MTNREHMIGLLADPNFIDDGGVAYESMVHYNVGCPYCGGDERALCHVSSSRHTVQRGIEITYNVCTACKEKWLDSEVDE